MGKTKAEVRLLSMICRELRVRSVDAARRACLGRALPGDALQISNGPTRAAQKARVWASSYRHPKMGSRPRPCGRLLMRRSCLRSGVLRFFERLSFTMPQSERCCCSESVWQTGLLDDAICECDNGGAVREFAPLTVAEGGMDRRWMVRIRAGITSRKGVSMVLWCCKIDGSQSD